MVAQLNDLKQGNRGWGLRGFFSLNYPQML